MSPTAPGPDGHPRCAWCLATPGYVAYHDSEWGFPVDDDIRLFEKLSLEAFQSGLSWRTILEKREGFRAAFDGFDFRAIAGYDDSDVARLLADSGIVRHRGKIEATINNARRAVDLVAEEGSLARYVWRFAPEDTTPHRGLSQSPLSQALSKDLKKRGWKFVGPTTVHSFLQAMGMIDDHAEGCVTRAAAAHARAEFRAPG
ncbi:MAG: DNA-3-methyladenine glycosylase I [Rhodobacter sp.]|nr:DNA-3-methyladenine glycosylase I [Paracoccaceae bacterium]MCC0075672.1 DNA-3-methyladenine glycosylase I [Rhodobacter sp.]